MVDEKVGGRMDGVGRMMMIIKKHANVPLFWWSLLLLLLVLIHPGYTNDDEPDREGMGWDR